MKLVKSLAVAAFVAGACVEANQNCKTETAIVSETGIDAANTQVKVIGAPAGFKVEMVVGNSDVTTLSVDLEVRGANATATADATITADGSLVTVDLSAFALDTNVDNYLDEDCLEPILKVKVNAPTDTCWKRAAGDLMDLTILPGANCVRILHINDMHAYVEGIASGACKGNRSDDKDKNDAVCDGGWAKIFTLVKQMAKAASGRTIFVDAGDQFTGTVWSTVYSGSESVAFLNLLCDGEAADDLAGCVGGVGNHEFDVTFDRLIEYTENTTFPIINSNMDDSSCANSMDIDKSIIMDVTANNKKIGFVGYLTPLTPTIAKVPACVKFQKETTAIAPLLANLKNVENVDFTVAIAHSGYDMDQLIAADTAVSPNLNLVIGAHSHTTLWNTRQLGDFPSSKANKYFRGPKDSSGLAYPTIVNQVDIVQAGSFSRFLGGVDVIFEDGQITITPLQEFVNGAKIAEDQEALDLINSMVGAVDALGSKSIGTLSNSLFTTRTGESTMGNVVADAMLADVKANAAALNVQFAMANSGGVRTDLPAGEINFGSVIAVLPFANVITVLEMTGNDIHLMLEHGVSRQPFGGGEYPQVSGFKYVFDSDIAATCGQGEDFEAMGGPCMRESAVNRIISVTDNEGNDIPNSKDVTYNMATNDFIAAGGDNYKILTQVPVKLALGNALDQLLADYIQANGETLATTIEGRSIDLADARADATVAPTDATVKPTAAPTAAPEEEKEKADNTVTVAVLSVFIAVSAIFVFWYKLTQKSVATLAAPASEGGDVASGVSVQEPKFSI